MKTEREIYQFFEELFENKKSDLNLIDMPKKVRKNGLKNYYLHLKIKIDKDKAKNKSEEKIKKWILDKIFEEAKYNFDLDENYMEKTLQVYRYLNILSKNFNNRKIKNKKYSGEESQNVSFVKFNETKFCNIGLTIDKRNNKVSEKINLKDFDKEKKLQYEMQLNNKSNFYKELEQTLDGYANITEIRQLLSPMIVGLGDTDTKEVSIKLDHVTGIPYIPASTIKGAFRSFMEWRINENDKNKDFLELLFGNDSESEKSKIGNLMFMDAYPTKNGFTIEPDIMTPHYKNYYDGKNPIRDSNLIMIKFYTVKNAEFQFKILYPKLDEKDSKIIRENFKIFLDEEALGAKKNVGYGIFTRRI